VTLTDQEKVHQIIQSAVHRANGNWKQSFRKEVDEIVNLVNECIKDAIELLETD